MRCPSCQQSITETTAVCACGFSIEVLDRQFGVPPSLRAGVNDMVHEFTGRQARRIEAEIARMQRLFPQLQFAVITCDTPPQSTLPLFMFWLFNRGGMSSAVQRGSENRLVLLCIDSHTRQAACMIGYGLEPFVSEERLNAAVQAGMPDLLGSNIAAGVMRYLQAMEEQLTEAVEVASKALGLDAVPFEGYLHFLETEEEPAIDY